MKKIICVHLFNDYSGSPKVLSQVIHSLKQKNLDVAVYTSNTKGFLSDSVLEPHTFYYKWSKYKVLTLLLLLFSQIHLAFKLLKYRKQDVVIYVNTLLPFGAAVMGKMFNKPVIYHIHETSIKPKLFKQFLRWVVTKTATKIIFVSQALQTLEQFNNKTDSIIYNALPKAFAINALHHNYQQLYDNCFNVYMICSLKVYKGVYEFVSIAKACGKYPEITFNLILNSNTKEIQAFFKDIKLPKNLTLLSTQNNLDIHYKKASLVLNLTREELCIETFGLTILEAMAYGIPVIVPTIGGPTELVEQGKQGYLMSSHDTLPIVEKIIELFRNRDLCMNLSKNAKDKAKLFNEDVFSSQIIKLLND